MERGYLCKNYEIYAGGLLISLSRPQFGTAKERRRLAKLSRLVTRVSLQTEVAYVGGNILPRVAT